MTAFNSLGSSPSSRSLVPDAKQTSQKQVEIEEPSLNEPSQVLPDIQKSPPAPAVSISNIAQSVFLNYLPNVNVVAPEPVQDSPETSLTKEDVLFQDNPETNLLREDVLFQDNPETKGNKEDATVLYENTAAPSPEAAPTPEAPPLSPQDQQTNDRMRQLWDNINKAVPNASNKPQKLKNLLGTPIDFVYPITMFFGVRPQGGIVGEKGHVYIQQELPEIKAVINGTSNLETILKAGEIVEKSGWGNCSEGTAVAIKEFLEMVAGMDPPPPDAKIRWEFREDGHRYAVAQLNGLEFIIDRWGEYCGPRDANHPEPTKSADVSPWFTPDDYKQATGRK